MNTETLRLLVSKGLSAEDILEIAETLDQPKPRSAAAERQARYRARKKSNEINGEEVGSVTRDVTRDGNSDASNTLDKKAPHTPKKIKPKSPPIVPPKRNGVPAKPEDVSEQVWDDWLALRKAKRAPVSQSVIDGARREAAQLDWPLEQFLAEWVMRGSQGLKAEWIGQRNTGPPGRSAEPQSFLAHVLASQASQ